MQTTTNGTNGSPDGDIREVPETFKLSDWPRNGWYAAAYDVEVRRELLGRRIGDHSLVLYRREDGRAGRAGGRLLAPAAAAVEGKLVGDDVVCGYHGLRLRRGGPLRLHAVAGDDQPGRAVRCYPVVERHRFVWVWPGDPALADPDLIPDLHWNDDPEWAGDGKMIHARLQLPADRRQPDGPHPRDVRARRQHRAAIDRRGRRSRSPTAPTLGHRHPVDARHRAAAVLADATAGSSRRATRAQRRPLADHPLRGARTIAIDVGVAPTGTGAPEGDRSQGVNGYVLNTMTPGDREAPATTSGPSSATTLEDQRSPRSCGRACPASSARTRSMLEAQQRAIDANPGLRVLQPQHRRRRRCGPAA